MKNMNLNLQVKALQESEELGIIEAYGNVKWKVDRVKDCTVDGAFTNSIQKAHSTGRMPKMLLQHDHKQVCGVWLEMEEDEHGLRMKGQLALTTEIGRETFELIKMGALDSLSIGYVVKDSKYDPSTKITYLSEVDIHEVSIVTFACNEDSLIDSVKSDLTDEPEVAVEAPEIAPEEVIEEVEPITNPTPEDEPEGFSDEDLQKLKLIDLALRLQKLHIQKLICK